MNLRQHALFLIVATGCLSVGANAVSAGAAPLPGGGPAPRVEAMPVPVPSATRVSGDLRHGELGGEIWGRAEAVDAFVEREPKEGADPSRRTDFRVAYDASTLYVRVIAYDEPGNITSYLTRRDVESPSDWIRVLVDSYHDKRTAYEFAVNPAGVKRDTYWFNDNQSDNSWDAVWDVTVARNDQGWSAEFRIPFSQLRFRPGDDRVFGFAVIRHAARVKEISTWPLLARSANGFVSSFGELGGLSMQGSPRRLEVLPYMVGSFTSQPAGSNPLIDARAPGGALGLDVKYAVTPGLTLTSTFNPDFGQVEADPAVVNLSAFETFYSERRPFFVEGSGNFRFDVDCGDGDCTGLFYSRRIGRAPQGGDALPSSETTYTDTPSQSRILGATKLTGRLGSYSIGVMHAVTSEQQARVADGPRRFDVPVEPLTQYSVARVRREFADQSSFGFMVTSTNRQLPSDLLFLPNRAFSGGVDGDLRFKQRYSLQAFFAASTVRGTPEAIDRIQENSRHYFQRPGLASAHLDPLRTSLDGMAGRISLGKIGGQRVRFNSSLSFKSPGFDINDLGYFRRADQRSVSNWVQIRNDEPNRWFRQRMINFNQYASWNFDGDRLWSGGNVNAHAQFLNNWRIGGGFNVNGRGFDDRLSRGGPGGLVEGNRNFWHYVEGDDRKPIALSYFGAVNGDGHGSSRRSFEPGITWRPRAALSATFGVNVERDIQDAQWVGAFTDTTDHYVFGRLDQTTVSMTARLNYTMSPTLSLQLYAQPFVSGGSYSNVRQLVDGRNPEYGQRYAPYAYDYDVNGNPDFNVKSFRTTNVLRWEYKPGSTLFVVWQQARENDAVVDGSFRFGRDFGDVFSAGAKNVFLVKFAYWLNY